MDAQFIIVLYYSCNFHLNPNRWSCGSRLLPPIVTRAQLAGHARRDLQSALQGKIVTPWNARLQPQPLARSNHQIVCPRSKSNYSTITCPAVLMETMLLNSPLRSPSAATNYIIRFSPKIVHMIYYSKRFGECMVGWCGISLGFHSCHFISLYMFAKCYK